MDIFREYLSATTPANSAPTIGTNAEMRWEAMAGQSYLTPAARFFVRNHTATPRIASMSPRVTGC